MSKVITGQQGVEYNLHQLVKAFKVQSEPTRVRTLSLLMKRECCVCKVAQALDISQTRASSSLQLLRNAGFLKLKRIVLWSLYSVDKKEMPAYLHRLVETFSYAVKDNEIIV
jgi:ArsR family transcriptional regulator